MEKIIIEKITYLVSRKWFYLFLVPFLLFLFGVVSAIYHIISYETYFTVMPVLETQSTHLQIPQSQLADNTVVRGEFTASMNNLGAVGLKVKDMHDDTVSDHFQVVFRIKELHANKWYSSNSYTGGQFHDLNLFPFGFAPIANSQNKTYVFELFSKGANMSDALTVDPSQSIVGQYLLQKSDLKKPSNAEKYVIGKLTFLFHNLDGIFSTLIYFLPLYGYFYLLAEKERIVIPFWFSLILLLPIMRKILVTPFINGINSSLKILQKCTFIDEYKPVKTVPTINILLFLTMLTDIFFVNKTNNLLLLIVIILWFISVIMYHFRLQSSFLLAVAFLLFSLILLLVGFGDFAEQAAIWCYLFLLIGALHSLVLLRPNRNHN